MIWKSKQILAFSLVLMMLFSLVACGNASTDAGSNTAGSKTSSSTVQPQSQEVVLKVLNWGNLEEEAIFNEAIARFESAHPGVKVEQTITPVESWSNFIEKWITMSTSGNAPDLINIGLEGAQMALANNLILPLNEMIASDSEMDIRVKTFAKPLLEGFSKDGELYAVPNGSQTMVMYYNKAVFDAKNIEYPTENWTWDEFRQKAAALTFGEGDNKVYGFGLPIAYFQLTPWWVTNDAYPCTKDYSAPDLTNPNMVESLEFITGLVKDGISPDPKGVDIYSQFAAGKLAMVGAGRWVLNSWTSGGLRDFDCVQWPMNKKSGTVYGGAAWGIGSSTMNKELAFDLVKEFTSNETLAATASLGQQIPPTENLATDSKIMGTVPDSIGLLWEAVTNSTPVAAPTFFGDLEQATIRAIENAITGSASPADALAQAQTEVEAVIKK